MDVAVHVGTVFAVIAYNWRELCQMAMSLISFGGFHRDKLGVTVSALIATIPVIIAGYILNQFDGAIQFLRNVEVIAWATFLFLVLCLVLLINQSGRPPFCNHQCI